VIKENKYTAGKLLRLALALIPAVLIELLCAVTLSMTETVEGGERKLVLLIHVIALLSAALPLYRRRLAKPVSWIVAALAPALAFVMMEYITHLVIRDVAIPAILLNLILYYLAALVALCLFGHTAGAVAFITIFPVCVGYISYYTTLFRGVPLLPWDIASFKTAMGVVGNYTFVPTPRGMFVFALALFQVQLGFACNRKVNFRRLYARLGAIALSAVLLAGACLYTRSDSGAALFRLEKSISNVGEMYRRDGFMPAFLLSTRYNEKPENYSRRQISQLAERYSSDMAGGSEERPHVIVIMNESYSDLSVLGDYETSEEIFPFISSLDENTIKGNAHVSVLGGNTPNSEFEFLTGLTMGFLPQGVIAYQQYIKEPVPSLATQFNTLGYRTIGTHAFWGPSWNRDRVYPLLGFQELCFQDSFPENAERLRLWITDGEMYRKVEDLYESSEEPLFLFGITMMNHGGYHGTTENFDPYVYIKGLEDNGPVREYMTLMRETDKAFEELVTYFSQAEEKTVILMFGDHQPNDSVAQPILDELGVSIDQQKPQQLSKRYVTPYIIWANYDIDAELPEDVSLNYLGAMLVEICGLEKTGMQKYLLELAEEFPVISSKCYMDRQGEIYPLEGYQQSERLLEYASLQYNYLIDSLNREERLWNLAG